MTEEIIKECEFYLPLSEDCNEILDDNGNEIYKCSSRQDCYYKQLKRLEQENKTLKNSLKDFQYSDEQHLLKVIELEKENEELKSLNKKICEDWEKEIKYYWEALEEIREMSKKSADVFDCTGCYDIYNKINEVLQ